MKKLLIVDPLEHYYDALCQKLGHCLEISVCRNYRNVSQLIASVCPDFLVMDFTSSEYEGFTTLRAAKCYGANPAVIAIIQTSLYFTTLCLQEKNIASTIGRPINFETLANRLSLMMNIPKDQLIPLPSRREYLADMLSSLGISISSRGGCNLLDIIPMAADDPELSFTKHLYPAAGKRTGHSGQNVERNIRTAIENGWNQGNQCIWSQYFPVNEAGYVEKPCNSDFIILLAKLLNMQRGQYCDEP